VGEPLWQLADVAVRNGATRRLGPLSVAIPRGVTAVLGGSGAGKTTLLEVLVGFTRPQHGRVQTGVGGSGAGGVPLFWAPEDGGLWPHLTVREHLDVANGGGAASGALLAAFDLDDCAARRPGTLSLGQVDRVNVARALATGADVLVMDEPLAHVDPARAGRYWHALQVELERTGASLVFATHEPRRAIELAEAAVCLADGALAFAGAIAGLHREPPTEALAWMLGETNWLAPADAERWLGRALARPSLRPEQVELVADERGPAVVTRSRHLGDLVQSDLRLACGAQRTFYHRTGPALRPGTHVAVRLLALCLACVALLAAGCADAERPALAFARVRHVPLQPEAARAPAPRCVVPVADGWLVLDDAGRVLVLDRDTAVVRQWRMPEVAAGNPEGVCRLRDGRSSSPTPTTIAWCSSTRPAPCSARWAAKVAARASSATRSRSCRTSASSCWSPSTAATTACRRSRATAPSSARSARSARRPAASSDRAGSRATATPSTSPTR
jgi:iron(III) transport system ATP-binding protein